MCMYSFFCVKGVTHNMAWRSHRTWVWLQRYKYSYVYYHNINYIVSVVRRYVQSWGTWACINLPRLLLTPKYLVISQSKDLSAILYLNWPCPVLFWCPPLLPDILLLPHLLLGRVLMKALAQVSLKFLQCTTVSRSLTITCSGRSSNPNGSYIAHCLAIAKLTSQ